MPGKERFKTNYPGVYFIESNGTGGPEKVYYIFYRKYGKQIEEKAGRQYQDDMTPAKAAHMRYERIKGIQSSNKNRREADLRAKKEEEGKWTLSKLWLEYESQRPDSKAIKTDKGRFKKHLEPTLGKKQPHEIIRLDVDRLRIKISNTLKPQTVRHIMGLLKRIVAFGVKRQMCQGLCFQVDAVRVDNVKTEDLTKKQLRSLLEAIEQSHDIEAANIMRMALFTGMRRGELFKLKWSDVDFDRGFITIRDPKGGVSQKIPMNEQARKVLKDHPKTAEYVFIRSDGKPFTDIRRRVNPIKKAAGIPDDFRALHGLRHVYASMLASSGQVDMYTLQKLLTHKSPLMTQRYAHLRDETMRKASTLAGNIIEEAAVKKDLESETLSG